MCQEIRSQDYLPITLLGLPFLSSTPVDALFVISLATYLQYLSWIATGTGVFFAIIFLIGAKEPQKLNEVEKQPTCVGNIEDHVAMSDEDGKNDENRYHATKEPQRRLRTNSTYSSIMVSQGQDPCGKAPK